MNTVRQTLAIARRELTLLFGTPLAWLLLAICCGVFALWPPRGWKKASTEDETFDE